MVGFKGNISGFWKCVCLNRICPRGAAVEAAQCPLQYGQRCTPPSTATMDTSQHQAAAGIDDDPPVAESEPRHLPCTLLGLSRRGTRWKGTAFGAKNPGHEV